MVKIRPAVFADAYFLGNRLRQQDLDEVQASHGLSGQEATLISYYNSTITYVAEINDCVECIFGVAKSQKGGYPWLLASDAINTAPVSFFRISRKYMHLFSQKFGFLENYVDARNTLSIQWLVWLGFKLDPPQPFGVEQRLFHRFTKEGE